ncbi:MAG: HesB/IscA family protein [Luteolibacter sp.]|jgi:iron-sulfur cluster assembly accessory protein
MMTLTPIAARRLADMLAQKADSAILGLRLAVRRGGCAGWQYEMEVAEPEVGDQVIEQDGARLIVAADSLERLKGCQIDYSDDLSDAGFKVINPNASRSCGCGTSFEATDEKAGAHALPESEDCGD